MPFPCPVADHIITRSLHALAPSRVRGLRNSYHSNVIVIDHDTAVEAYVSRLPPLPLCHTTRWPVRRLRPPHLPGMYSFNSSQLRSREGQGCVSSVDPDGTARMAMDANSAEPSVGPGVIFRSSCDANGTRLPSYLGGGAELRLCEAPAEMGTFRGRAMFVPSAYLLRGRVWQRYR